MLDSDGSTGNKDKAKETNKIKEDEGYLCPVCNYFLSPKDEICPVCGLKLK